MAQTLISEQATKYAFAYLRVSTDDQTTDNQRLELSKYAEQGVIKRNKQHGGFQYRPFIRRHKNPKEPTTALFLQLLGELGDAYASEIIHIGSKRYPDRPLKPQFVYATCYRLKQRGKIAKDNEGKYYIQEQKEQSVK